MRKLDKKRDYQTVHGNETGKEAYCQDGLYFDAAGNEIPGQKQPAAKGATKAAEPAAAANDQVAKQLGTAT